MTISQSKIGEIKKKFTRWSRTRRFIKKCNNKGRNKNCGVRFLPDLWSQKVRFTLPIPGQAGSSTAFLVGWKHPVFVLDVAHVNIVPLKLDMLVTKPRNFRYGTGNAPCSTGTGFFPVIFGNLIFLCTGKVILALLWVAILANLHCYIELWKKAN